MFTGLVQALGTVSSLQRGEESAKISFTINNFLRDCEIGDSIAVNGVCLTVTALTSNKFDVDVMIQTLKVSSLGDLFIGSRVNLELAARVSDRLGGHIVQGHVDGVGEVIGIDVGEQWMRMDVVLPSTLMKYVQTKGSICIDGTSLTVGELDDEANSISVWLIPETLRKTILGDFGIGTKVNIEVDVLAKYVERLLKRDDA